MDITDFKITLVSVLLNQVFLTVVMSDTIGTQTSTISASLSGSSYCIEIPYSTDLGQGACISYSLKFDGSSVENWRIKNWLPQRCFVSDDGKVIVGVWPRHDGDKPKSEDIAIEFVRNGKKLKDIQ